MRRWRWKDDGHFDDEGWRNLSAYANEQAIFAADSGREPGFEDRAGQRQWDDDATDEADKPFQEYGYLALNPYGGQWDDSGDGGFDDHVTDNDERDEWTTK